MPVDRTLRSGNSAFYLDTTEDSIDLVLASQSNAINRTTRIILVKGANSAVLNNASTVINLSSSHSAVTTITWSTIGDSLTLWFDLKSKKWSIISYYGVTFS